MNYEHRDEDGEDHVVHATISVQDLVIKLLSFILKIHTFHPFANPSVPTDPSASANPSTSPDPSASAKPSSLPVPSASVDQSSMVNDAASFSSSGYITDEKTLIHLFSQTKARNWSVLIDVWIKFENAIQKNNVKLFSTLLFATDTSSIASSNKIMPSRDFLVDEEQPKT